MNMRFIIMKIRFTYPLTVRQSGFSITCVKDVTSNVESSPLDPCTSTEAPS